MTINVELFLYAPFLCSNNNKKINTTLENSYLGEDELAGGAGAVFG